MTSSCQPVGWTVSSQQVSELLTHTIPVVVPMDPSLLTLLATVVRSMFTHLTMGHKAFFLWKQHHLGLHLQQNTPSYGYRSPYYKPKTVWRPSQVYDENPIPTRYVDGTPTSEVTPVTIRYIRPPHHGHTSQYHGLEWMTCILFVPCQSAAPFLR